MARVSTKLAALFQAARRIWDENPEIHDGYGSPESFDYWRWFLCYGFEEYPEIEPLLPIAPRPLLRRVLGHGNRVQFHRGGQINAQQIFEAFAGCGFSLHEASSLLDFGSGCGRILRHFARLADRCRLVGVDVDGPAVQWCKEHLDFADYARIEPVPPTPFADGEFEAVYSFSVFSHLPEQNHLAWLAELQRITRPGATLVLTTQGRNCARRFAEADVANLAVPTPQRMRADLPRLERDGFLFYRIVEESEQLDTKEREQWDIVDPALYGMTFILEPYIRKRWTEYFELVDLIEAPLDWQDYVVLRRR